MARSDEKHDLLNIMTRLSVYGIKQHPKKTRQLHAFEEIDFSQADEFNRHYEQDPVINISLEFRATTEEGLLQHFSSSDLFMEEEDEEAADVKVRAARGLARAVPQPPAASRMAGPAAGAALPRRRRRRSAWPPTTTGRC